MPRAPKYKTSARIVDVKVQGLDDVMRRLKKELEAVNHRISTRGLVLVAEKIRRETETVYPLTPVDIGNLRASWFVVATEVGEVNDPLAISGSFRNRPFRKMRYKASELRARHLAVISASKAEVIKVRQPLMIMGYSAPYALYVHEIAHRFPNAEFKREGADWKWFQKAINRNIRTIFNIIKDNARIP
jgi:hypothetical protein